MAGQWSIVQDRAPRVWQVANTIFPSNCYICEAGEPGCCLLVDPGLDPAPIDMALKALDLRPVAILCTHGHFDHTGSASCFAREYGCPVYLHAADRKTLNASNFLLMAFKIPARVELPATIDCPGPSIVIGDDLITVHHTPGHTPGSCIFEFGSALFTGDTLYASGVGLSKLPGENPDLLRQSISGIVDILPHDGVVHPGHGRSAGLAWIIDHNAGLRGFLEAPQHHKAS